jgi:hypothetical protein
MKQAVRDSEESRLLLGSRWLCQRSRHCFPERDVSFVAICTHFSGPSCSTRRTRAASSEGVQGPFCDLGLLSAFQRSKQAVAVCRSSIKPSCAISAHDCEVPRIMMDRKISSSAFVHGVLLALLELVGMA